MNAREWKAFYAAERATMGFSGLEALFDRAPRLAFPPGGALAFPHTRLSHSGELIAAAARACVQAGAETVLALGVLHGAREQDAPLVEQARQGDPRALATLRGVFGQDLPGPYWLEEFSLDAFAVLLEHAAVREGRRPPRLMARYPFLVGTDPHTLPGLDALKRLMAEGALLVATTDPIHHGAGYGSPLETQRSRTDPATLAYARSAIEHSFALLQAGDFASFQAHTAACRSDFRDTGPVLAALLPSIQEVQIEALKLVDYADVLSAPEPTWVAAALASVSV